MKIVVQPTVTSQWYEFVKESELLTGISFDEHVQSYLILTLDSFMTHHPIPETPIAVEYLTAVNFSNEKSNSKLRDVGDHCLILCGLFPEHTKRKGVSLTYFIEIGQQAYLTLADRSNLKLDPKLFHKLGLNFLNLKEVLNAMRGMHSGRLLQ